MKVPISPFGCTVNKRNILKKKDNCFLKLFSFTILFCYFTIADSNNGNDIIDFEYCFPGRLTIIEFVFLKCVMLEDSGMFDTFGGKILK